MAAAVISAHSFPVPHKAAISSSVSVVTRVESMSKKKALKDVIDVAASQ